MPKFLISDWPNSWALERVTSQLELWEHLGMNGAHFIEVVPSLIRSPSGNLSFLNFRYVAPEYANTGLLNEKSDIYSFGVLLLEAITGRDPVDYARPSNEVSIIIRPFFTLPNLMVVHVYVNLLVNVAYLRWNFYYTYLICGYFVELFKELSCASRYFYLLTCVSFTSPYPFLFN